MRSPRLPPSRLRTRTSRSSRPVQPHTQVIAPPETAGLFSCRSPSPHVSHTRLPMGRMGSRRSSGHGNRRPGACRPVSGRPAGQIIELRRRIRAHLRVCAFTHVRSWVHTYQRQGRPRPRRRGIAEYRKEAVMAGCKREVMEPSGRGEGRRRRRAGRGARRDVVHLRIQLCLHQLRRVPGGGRAHRVRLRRGGEDGGGTEASAAAKVETRRAYRAARASEYGA